MALKKDEVANIVVKFGKNAADTGCTEVQVALLTKRIQKLTEHLKDNKQDAIAHRNLLMLVGKRHSLLDYLARTDREAYLKLIAELQLRK